MKGHLEFMKGHVLYNVKHTLRYVEMTCYLLLFATFRLLLGLYRGITRVNSSSVVMAMEVSLSGRSRSLRSLQECSCLMVTNTLSLSLSVYIHHFIDIIDILEYIISYYNKTKT